MLSNNPAAPEPAGAPFDPALLARLATELFAQSPGAPPFAPHGAQAPVNPAPPASPLSGPAGLGQGVPGTAIPQGLAPGLNLAPSSPHQVLSLGNRAPALLPAAQAGNGVPDKLLSSAPAYEPRLGGALTGAPQSSPAPATGTAPEAAYYFLDRGHGHPTAGAAPASVSAAPAASPAPQYYFVHAMELPSGFVTPAKGDPHPTHAPGGARHAAPFDVQAVRRDFPILQERVNGRQLVWFDNAATTHKPQAVIDRISEFYRRENSNIHRAAHELAARATDAYEGARERVRGFINAPDVNEVIFVRGTTEAINLVAKSWGGKHVGAGDEIVVSHLEHHANIVPWQQLAAEKGAKLRVIPVDDSGQVLLDEYAKLLNERTRIVAVTQVSNALGTVTPVREIVEMAHRAGALALVDGAQSVSHMRTDVQALGADFFVFSGHKVFGPTGIGVVWGKRAVLEDMPPWQGGGNMIADVTFEKTVFQPLPNTFEAGTGNIADAVGLGAAIDYVNRIGIENIASYEHALLEYGMQKLGEIPGLRLIGTAAHKASVMSFVLDGYSTEEVGRALNREGIAVRTGHHCAQPILRRFGVETTVRPSLAFYNTFDEIDRLVTVVRGLSAQRGRR
ncbi:family 2A encapsulin nanocompartment cargo protein cysteine desulfurase [Herbaspirillum sp. WKF16]|uniref:family 2A encapsulin nanocompartment cargo protein cysteine desulfurase n=1 Tax=Herbaspirillum sp. WKF16 TaxID=3028312 RepID=UPI0023A97486|nr:family 2A encapsulin nanocompartment cargo protein cysteine desulfurase [Herbaspirillum sp. WKF16]WDZ98429.1 family 2A encapsulin nanocompartment cargo protein cysteine desulfurase [Herbaspirillum sp. WKF16]